VPTRASTLNSVQKACRILRSLSGQNTSRLAEIAAITSLNKATVLRILDILAREGFVRRDDPTKSWSLGSESYILTAAATRRDDLRERLRPALMRIAAASEDTVLLSVRSGTQSVCVDREIGNFPIRANYLDVGSRRPLGVGAGSMALLAWLPDAEIEAILSLVKPALTEYPKITPKVLEREVERSRERGYTLFLDLIVPRMGGVGVPVPGPDGRPAAALSVAALSERISPRVEMLVGLMQKEAQQVANTKSGQRESPPRARSADAKASGRR
jgi:DNA-binding IclR family transcriptional regulator